VSETGIDAPVHTLTLEQVCHCASESVTTELTKYLQFLHVSNGRTPQAMTKASTRNSSPDKIGINHDGSFQRRQRSMSVGEELGVPDLDERMKHTRAFKLKGFKGNTRGSHIQAPFATLEELFKKLPENVGFNMELSMFMLAVIR
jgi:glycerophosphodiester phosphodiesterase